jgi:hypothetical protein
VSATLVGGPCQRSDDRQGRQKSIKCLAMRWSFLSKRRSDAENAKAELGSFVYSLRLVEGRSPREELRILPGRLSELRATAR